jgi:hypothetical protein
MRIRFNVSRPRSEWKPHYGGNLTVNFALMCAECKKGAIQGIFIYGYEAMNPICMVAAQTFAQVRVTDSGRGQEGPRLGHERFGPSQPQ